MSKGASQFLGLIVVFILVATASSAWKAYNSPASYSAPRSRTPSAPFASRGEDIRLRKDTFAAATEDDFRAFSKALVAPDNVGALNMLDSGQAFEISAGTMVKVIGGTITLVEVRVMEGPDAGRSAWTFRESVR
jgi:hypothetical protein